MKVLMKRLWLALIALTALAGLLAPTTPTLAHHTNVPEAPASFRLPFVGGRPDGRPHIITAGPCGSNHGGNGYAENHEAIDFKMDEGTEIIAAEDGIFHTANEGEDAGGYVVIIDHEQFSLKSKYAHLQANSYRVSEGQPVKKGQVIALSGDTGNTSGPHLHFAVLTVNYQPVSIRKLPGITWYDPTDQCVDGSYDGEAFGPPVDSPSTPTPTPTPPPSSIKMSIDKPTDKAIIAQGSKITVGGWGIDQAASSGTGIDAAHLYLDGQAGSGGTGIAIMTYGIERPDVARIYGERYRYSGYNYLWDTKNVSPGPHTLYIYLHSTKTGWAYFTRMIYITLPSTACLKPLYRYWNDGKQAHFYTANWAELGAGKDGWKWEGIVGYVAVNTSCYAPNAIPLFRLRSDSLQRHMYTTSSVERSTLEKSGWTYESTVGYVLPAANSTYKTQPLYRLYKDSTRDHFFTTSSTERDNADNNSGYTSEGVACYTFSSAALP